MSIRDDYAIVIPSYRPDRGIINIVDELKRYFDSIVVVDDGSSSDYSAIFKNLEIGGVHVIYHAANQGKGRALKTAFNFCILNQIGKQGVITVDGDGQHAVEDVVKVAECMESNKGAVVLGCRSFDNKTIPLRSRFGNKISRILYGWACGLKIQDTQTGLRGIPFEHLPLCCKIAGEKYDYETNMLLSFKDAEIEILETKIQTIYENKNATSHFNPIKDSALIYGVIIKYSFSSIVTSIADYSVFSLLLLVGMPIIISTYLARLIAGILNFTINKTFVFNDKEKLMVQFVKYWLLVLTTGTVSGMLISYFSHLLTNISPVVIKIPVEIVLYFLNFLVQRKLIFKRRR